MNRPKPPLSAIGLTQRQFTDFENKKASGITCLDTYFILADGELSCSAAPALVIR